MALIDVTLRYGGGAIGRMSGFRVIVPERKTGPFPTLYLLHGLSDDHTAWTARTSVERYVEDLPLIVVMPNGQRGWYTDAVNKPSEGFETYIARELVGFVDATFPTIAARGGRALAGLSMGGYGALKLALKNPDLFCAAHSFSGAVDMSSRNLNDNTQWVKELKLVFGDVIAGTPNDLFALTKDGDPATRPAISFDCGVKDFLIEDNRRFHAHLNALGIDHVYAEYPGDHNWEYWDTHIQDALPWIARQLGIAGTDPLPDGG
jgi:S-formylglutathione hydrolase FrmB